MGDKMKSAPWARAPIPHIVTGRSGCLIYYSSFGDYLLSFDGSVLESG